MLRPGEGYYVSLKLLRSCDFGETSLKPEAHGSLLNNIVTLKLLL